MKKILFLFVITSSFLFAQNYGTWSLTDSLNIPRWHSASVELANGNVLVSGGISQTGNIGDSEIFNSKLEKWEKANPMILGRAYHLLIKLNNGNILAIGGDYENKSCEIYDTTTKTWSLTDSLNYQRTFGETATLLGNGNVLIIGGYYLAVGNTKFLKSCEIYNINIKKWTITDSLKIDREFHTATKLLDGKVLVTGGFSGTQKELSDCEIYDPNTGKWTEAAPLNVARYEHAATLLPDGKVLVTGGENNSNPTSAWLNSCELYDPAQNTWTIVDSLIVPHSLHSAVLLQNNLLLIAGGGYDSNVWELYNPINFTNVYVGNFPNDTLSTPLVNILPNGKVLSAGGMTWTNGDLPVLSAAKVCYLYDPGNINGIVKDKDNTVKDFELNQNYPNPFNPETIISWQLAISSTVTLKIYDSLGREILTLLNNAEQTPGKHSIVWNGKDEHGSQISSGVYFYILQAGEYSSAKKMIYLK